MQGPDSEKRDESGNNEPAAQGLPAEPSSTYASMVESRSFQVGAESSTISTPIGTSEEADLTQLPETVPSKFPESAIESAPVETEDEETDDGHGKVMSVIDHLDELRTRLIRTLIVFAIAMSISFIYGRDIIAFLELPAKGMHFQALSIEEPVLVYFKVSFYASLMMAAPWVLWEISAFIAPGLKRSERKILAPIVFGGPLLFVAGAYFCYSCALPPMLSFFNSFSGPIAPVQQRLDYYISLVTSMIFYMGLCFQLPIVLFALSLAGIVKSGHLISFWRYAVVGCSVVAAVITPDPTVISMLIVMAALLALYFLTIILLKVFGR